MRDGAEDCLCVCWGDVIWFPYDLVMSERLELLINSLKHLNGISLKGAIWVIAGPHLLVPSGASLSAPDLCPYL